MQPVADGEMGDLLVRGSTVMSGYWDDPERNQQVLVRRPGDAAIDGVYFRTGDRARRRRREPGVWRPGRPPGENPRPPR